MLYVPGVNDRNIRMLVEETLPGGDYEGSIAGGAILVYDSESRKVYIAEYEYTENEWYATIGELDTVHSEPWFYAYEAESAEKLYESGEYDDMVKLMNEYQAGALDGVGYLRDMEPHQCIWRGKIGDFDHTQLATETMLIDKLRELV